MGIPPPNLLLDYEGKVIIVTGASSGLGAGIATRFAEAGASVVVNYRTSKEGACTVVRKIEVLGRRAVAVQGDVSRSSDAERLIDAAVSNFGGLNVLVNNAGTYPPMVLLEMTESEWDEALAANLRSVHVCTQCAARHMVRQGRGGAIVNIASIAAENPAQRHIAYNTAKAGMLMYTRSAAQELGRHAIRVNAVSPGLCWREGIEQRRPDDVKAYQRAAALGRLGQFDEVADACLFLASPAARWITGANLLVDGGVMTNRIW